MPHLHIKEFKEIEFSKEQDGIKFLFMGSNHVYKEERLIATEFEQDRFFLLVKEEEGKVLLKSDKLTRPASIYSVHRALLAYAKAAELEVLSSNVPDKPKNQHLEDSSALKSIEYFASSFPHATKICVEVGFGSGRHILHQAQSNPGTLYIGLEIHRPSIEQVLKQVSIKRLDNLMVLDYDARIFLELIPSNVIDTIFVHFPVPWDKKPHRRVISKAFIEEAKRVLKVDGRLELRTDSENYYAFAYETFISLNKVSLEIHKNRDIAIVSKYEDRWRRQEKNIYDVKMINDELSEALSLEGGFAFPHATTLQEGLEKLHGVTKRFDEGFVHFERVYDLHDGVMLRLSLGSFDRPEHLYVIIQNGSVSYYPTQPLKSKSNLRAHEIICEVLYG